MAQDDLLFGVNIFPGGYGLPGQGRQHGPEAVLRVAVVKSHLPALGAGPGA